MEREEGEDAVGGARGVIVEEFVVLRKRAGSAPPSDRTSDGCRVRQKGEAKDV